MGSSNGRCKHDTLEVDLDISGVSILQASNCDVAVKLTRNPPCHAFIRLQVPVAICYHIFGYRSSHGTAERGGPVSQLFGS